MPNSASVGTWPFPLCKSFLLQGHQLLDLGPTLEPGCSPLEIPNLITPAKILFPNRFTFTGVRAWLECFGGLGGHTVQPNTLHFKEGSPPAQAPRSLSARCLPEFCRGPSPASVPPPGRPPRWVPCSVLWREAPKLGAPDLALCALCLRVLRHDPWRVLVPWSGWRSLSPRGHFPGPMTPRVVAEPGGEQQGCPQFPLCPGLPPAVLFPTMERSLCAVLE